MVKKGTVPGTDFMKAKPEPGELLVFDYYGNGTVTMVVRVKKVKKTWFRTDNKFKIKRGNGKVLGFDHAVVRRDTDAVAENVRKALTSRLLYYSFELLPESVLRALNKILDYHEIKKSQIQEKYAVADIQHKERGKKAQGKSWSWGNSNGKSAKQKQAESLTTMKRKSVLEDDDRPKKHKHRHSDGDDN